MIYNKALNKIRPSFFYGNVVYMELLEKYAERRKRHMLRKFIKKLYTDEAKDEVLVRAVEKNILMDYNSVDIAIRYLTEIGEIEQAHELLNKYDRHGHHASICKEEYKVVYGNVEQMPIDPVSLSVYEEHRKRIENKRKKYAENTADIEKAAEHACLLGNYITAIRNYEKLCNFKECESLSYRINDKKRAELYRKLAEMLES
jgi:hypothetical protein